MYQFIHLVCPEIGREVLVRVLTLSELFEVHMDLLVSVNSLWTLKYLVLRKLVLLFVLSRTTSTHSSVFHVYSIHSLYRNRWRRLFQNLYNKISSSLSVFHDVQLPLRVLKHLPSFRACTPSGMFWKRKFKIIEKKNLLFTFASWSVMEIKTSLSWVVDSNPVIDIFR